VGRSKKSQRATDVANCAMSPALTWKVVVGGGTVLRDELVLYVWCG
jgi:hypothetical protein